jgi:peptidoglycan-associated lipoprotein
MRYPGWSYLRILPLLFLPLFLAGCPKAPASMPAAVPAAPVPPAALGGATPSLGAAEPPGAGLTPPAVASPAAPGAAPAARAAVPPSPKEFLSALKDIYFDFDRSEISPAAAKILEENARWLKANPRQLLLVEGHCDERGTAEYNLALGERRATSARTFLTSLGITADRITTISYGEERPACAEKSEGCWAQNRRAHFLVKME